MSMPVRAGDYIGDRPARPAASRRGSSPTTNRRVPGRMVPGAGRLRHGTPVGQSARQRSDPLRPAAASRHRAGDGASPTPTPTPGPGLREPPTCSTCERRRDLRRSPGSRPSAGQPASASRSAASRSTCRPPAPARAPRSRSASCPATTSWPAAGSGCNLPVCNLPPLERAAGLRADHRRVCRRARPPTSRSSPAGLRAPRAAGLRVQDADQGAQADRHQLGRARPRHRLPAELGRLGRTGVRLARRAARPTSTSPTSSRLKRGALQSMAAGPVLDRTSRASIRTRSSSAWRRSNEQAARHNYMLFNYRARQLDPRHPQDGRLPRILRRPVLAAQQLRRAPDRHPSSPRREPRTRGSPGAPSRGRPSCGRTPPPSAPGGSWGRRSWPR